MSATSPLLHRPTLPSLTTSDRFVSATSSAAPPRSRVHLHFATPARGRPISVADLRETLKLRFTMQTSPVRYTSNVNVPDMIGLKFFTRKTLLPCVSFQRNLLYTTDSPEIFFTIDYLVSTSLVKIP